MTVEQVRPAVESCGRELVTRTATGSPNVSTNRLRLEPRCSRPRPTPPTPWNDGPCRSVRACCASRITNRHALRGSGAHDNTAGSRSLPARTRASRRSTVIDSAHTPASRQQHRPAPTRSSVRQLLPHRAPRREHPDSTRHCDPVLACHTMAFTIRRVDHQCGRPARRGGSNRWRTRRHGSSVRSVGYVMWESPAQAAHTLRSSCTGPGDTVLVLQDVTAELGTSRHLEGLAHRPGLGMGPRVGSGTEAELDDVTGDVGELSAVGSAVGSDDDERLLGCDPALAGDHSLGLLDEHP